MFCLVKSIFNLKKRWITHSYMEETPPHKLFTLIWLFTHFNLIENKVSWHQVIEDALVVALDEISARLKQENGGPRHALLGFTTIFSLSIFWGQVSSQFLPFPLQVCSLQQMWGNFQNQRYTTTHFNPSYLWWLTTSWGFKWVTK